MKTNKITFLMAFIITALLTVSCANGEKITYVAYQSLRNVDASKNLSSIPENAKIAIYPIIDSEGKLEIVVKNLTDELMTIDRQQSFFTRGDGMSQMYYDPKVETKTETWGNTKGGSVNVGSVTGALGLGGALQDILSGVNVGKSNNHSNSNTTFTIDQTKIHIPPHGKVTMGRCFDTGFGRYQLSNLHNKRYNDIDIPIDNTYNKFSVCIAFSIDQCKTIDKIESHYYANSLISEIVEKEHGIYDMNSALRTILLKKPNALKESYFFIKIGDPLYINVQDMYFSGSLIDYK